MIGSRQRAAPDRGEEEAGAHDRRDREDRLGGQHGVVLGVGDAGEQRALLGRQRVAVEPVGRGAGECDERTEDAEVHEGGPRGGPAAGQLEPAVDVVGEGGGDERQHEHDGDEADDEPQPGQGEDEEAHVEAELGVLDAEGLAVDPEQEGTPGAHRPRAREQPEHDRHHPDGQAAQRLDGLAVLLEHLLGGRDRDVEGAGTVGEDQAGGHGPAGEQTRDDEDADLGRELLDEDLDEADRLVPPHVGEHVGDDAADDDDGQQDQERGAQRAAPPAAGGSRLAPAPAVGPLGARRTVTRARGPVEPLRATH